MTLPADFENVIAVPGAASIIDALGPDGRTFILGETLAQVQVRYPDAVLMSWRVWQASQVLAQQLVPLTWAPVTADQYDEMLNILPPAVWLADGFLVGEAVDHDFATGRPRFQAYRIRGGRHEASARPLTVAEFRALQRGI